MKYSAYIFWGVLSLLTVAAAGAQPGVIYKAGPVMGEMVDAGFYYGDSNYHGIIQASDGNVYYVICSHDIEAGAQMFKYDPESDDVEMIGDLTDVVGEDRTKVINQGKVHSDLYEVDGLLYFGTHAGAWDETYPGGHYMAYDIAKQEFIDFGIGKPHAGQVAMSMDTGRMRMYAVTWPSYTFMYYDVESDATRNFTVTYAGYTEQGPRSLAVDPRTGNVYWQHENGMVACYDYDADEVAFIPQQSFDMPILRVPQGESYNYIWRSIRWSEAHEKFFGNIYNTDYLFSYDPEAGEHGEFELYDRICSAPNRTSGNIMYPSLAFELSEDGNTVYYIGHNLTDDAETPSDTELHLVTYDIAGRRYTDHGVIELSDGRRPRYCQGLEVGSDGSLYIVAWIPVTDLDTDKARRMLEIKTGGEPALEVERSKNLQEINLIVMDDPLW